MPKPNGNLRGLAPLDLIATTAHELKSPLVLIRGLAEMLAGGEFGKLNKTQAKYITKIYLASERMLQMSENLITVNRAHHDRLPITLEPVNLVVVMRGVIEELGPRLAAQGMTVIWSSSLKVPPVLGDRQLLYQIFLNLLDNTVKYSPPNTTVNIRFRRGPNHLAIQIRDQGFGIKPSDLTKLFERFGVVNRPINSQAGSSGLGLFIVKNLVQAHGGDVTAKPLPQGTCFTVKLPTLEQMELFSATAAEAVTV